MREWLARFCVWFVLWASIFWSAYEDSIALGKLCLLAAGAFTVYFFLPIVKRPIWLYLFLQCFTSFLALLAIHLPWVWLMLSYVAIEAIFKLSTKQYRVLLSFSFILFVLSMLISKEWSFQLLLFAILFSMLTILFNRSMCERTEQQLLYEQLLVEYRQLKRQHFENEQTVRLEERSQIARDLHDSVGHKLTALLMQLQMLSIQNQSSEYGELKELAHQSLEETRLAVKTLRNSEVAGVGSVLQLIRKLEAENHLLVRFTMKQGVILMKLTNDQSVVLYRSIQEALTNAMKHAVSKEVEVILGSSAIGEIEWQIASKINEPIQFQPGFGLTAMRERVEEQGGKLRVYQTETKFIVEGLMPVKGNVS